MASLCGALVKGVVPKNGVYLTLEDVRKNVVLGDEIHSCPTRIISLENTLGGTIMPLEEVQRISAFAREHRIKMHELIFQCCACVALVQWHRCNPGGDG